MLGLWLHEKIHGVYDLGSRIGCASTLTLVAWMAAPRVALADLEVNVDLTQPPHNMVLQTQTDPRWSPWYVGPIALAYKVDALGGKVNIGRCGCLMTAMSTSFTAIGPLGIPWYGHQQYKAGGGTQTILSFSPKYMNDYFNVGPALASRPPAWGFLPGSGGTNCSAGTNRAAPTGIAKSIVEDSPTGFTWVAASFASQRSFIDQALLLGKPSILLRHTYDAQGNQLPGLHANMIVGWDNTAKRYLVHDPMWGPTTFPDMTIHPRVAGTGFVGATDAERYAKYVASIDVVYVLETVNEPEPYLEIRDDPEPIKLRLTDPRGWRTGYDPETGENMQEDREARFEEVTSFTDPLGVLPEAEPYRYIIARKPIVGGYGLEVFGTGDGPYTLTLATVALDQSEDVATVTGNIVAGEVKRYEIVRQDGGSVSIAAVGAFAPRARAGNDGSVFLGSGLAFDGRGSYQIGGSISEYSWDFGDGETATGAQQTHTYATAGTFTATLTATNVDGLSGTDQRTVLVVDTATLPVMETVRVSTQSNGLQANGGGYANASVTPDGRYVAFSTTAPDLVPGDTNASEDVFVKDLETGVVERVSVAPDGTQALDPNGFFISQDYPFLSDDGRFVVFRSLAPNFSVNFDTLYVRDRMLGTTEVLTPGDGFPTDMSPDGRFVVYNSASAVYLVDRQTQLVEMISVSSTGVPGNDESSFGRVSDDGNLVAFMSESTNFQGSGIPYRQIFVRDRQAGTTTNVSRDSVGNYISDECVTPSMSGDGRFVSFGTVDPQVVPGDNNVSNDVFVRDRLLGTTERVSVSSTGEGGNRTSGGPAMSRDGRFVAFISASNNLAPNGAFTLQGYLRDRQEQVTTRFTVDINGMEAGNPAVQINNSFSQPLAVTSNGAVVFPSQVNNLVLNDSNSKADLFIRRLVPDSGAATTPIANLGGPYLGWATSNEVPAGIRLDASASADPQGRPLVAAWDFGDGSTIDDGDLVTTHEYAAPGVYTVTVMVRAGTDTSETLTTEVEVMAALGTGDLTLDACAAPQGTLKVSGLATANNLALAAIGWDRSAGPMPTEPAVVTFPWGDVEVPTRLPGLTFRGEVTVPAGTDSGSFVATLAGAPDAKFTVPCGVLANHPPEAVAGGPVYKGKVGVPLALDGSGSLDAEGSALTYAWYFGDGTMGTGDKPEHVYEAEGDYMITLVVNDGTQDSADMVGTRSYAMAVIVPDEGGAGGGGGGGGEGGGSDGGDGSGGLPGDGLGGPAVEGGGCGCGTAPGGTRAALGIGIALLAVASERRRRRRHVDPYLS